MITRLSGWWKLWMTLAVVWTVVVMIYGWMNLPRAQYMPHDPLMLSKLSNEASAILRVTNASVKPVRGALVWSDEPRSVRMSNGARVMFPATTTDERAAIVAGEYHQLLSVEANRQRAPYVLEMLMLWLAPLLATGVALRLLRGRGEWRSISRYVRQRTEKFREEGDNRLHDGAPANPV